MEQRGSPRSLGVILVIAGGAVALVGTLLEWVKVSMSGDLGAGSFASSTSGLDTSDGKIVIVAALVAIVVGIVAISKNGKVPGVLALIAGLAAGGAALVDGLTIKDQFLDNVVAAAGGEMGGQVRALVEDWISSGLVEVGPGIGLWLCVIGGAAACVGGILLLAARAPAAAVPGFVPMAPGGTSVPPGYPAPPPPPPAGPPAPPPAPPEGGSA